MTRSKILVSALGAAFLAAATLSSPAYALEAKQCGTREEITAALRDEGQFELISGQRAALGLPKNIFTSNRDRTVGYNLEAGVDSEAGKVCVRAKFTDIRLNSDPQLARPQWASFGPNTAHDQHLARMEAQDNDKVLMGANALIRQADGSERAGAFLMVTRGNPAPGTPYRSGGEATVTTKSGGITTLLPMANVETSSNFSLLANRPVQTASADQVAFRPR